MSAFNNVDYKDTHFEFKELTSIRGEPTYETLTTLLKQLKANARTVHSNLGGAAHGHLGIVISPASYALISPTAFARPIFPGTQPVIPPGTTNFHATILREQFKEALRVYHEVHNVDKALKQQLVSALEPMYLDAVRDQTTNTIIMDVHDIMQHFFDQYGDVTPETFQEREATVKSYTYDLDTPIDNLFKEIEDLVDLSGTAHIPMTPEQAITIAYVILWRTSALKESLREWNNLPAADKTWTRFKTHFRTAVKIYKQLRGPTVQNSVFQQHSANILRDLKLELRTVITDEIQRHTAHLASSSPSQEPYHDPYSYSPIDLPPDHGVQQRLDQMANAITEYQQLVPSLVNQVQQLQSTIKQLKMDERFVPSGPRTNITSDTSTMTTTSPNPSSHGNYSFNPPFHLYCHTHGLCAHNGHQCNAPSDRHKKEATFFKRMRGNNRNCSKAMNNN